MRMLISTVQPCRSAYNITFGSLNISFAGNAEHDYESLVQWDAQAITSDCINWLFGVEPENVTYSRSWLFSNLKTEKLLSRLLPERLGSDLRVLVEMTSLLHNWGAEDAPPELPTVFSTHMQAEKGNKVLRVLQTDLDPVRVATKSSESRYGLLLLLFGTMLAVSYSMPRDGIQTV